jgi:hypothetical protein
MLGTVYYSVRYINSSIYNIGQQHGYCKPLENESKSRRDLLAISQDGHSTSGSLRQRSTARSISGVAIGSQPPGRDNGAGDEGADEDQ